MTRLRLLVILIPAILAGCSSAPTVPPDNFYRIEVASPAIETTTLLPGTVLVHPVTASGLLQERPVLFTTAGQLHQMRQRDYHYWNEAPARMLQSALIAYLRAGRVAATVITPDLRVPVDFEVIGRVKRLEQILGEPSRVLVELELSVIDTASAQLVTARNYTAESASKEPTVAAAVLAFDRALADLFAEFVAELRNTGQRTIEADSR